LYLLSFSFSFLLTFESSGMAILSAGKSFLFYFAVLYQVSLLEFFDPW
jgi:hypothetical protein